MSEDKAKWLNAITSASVNRWLVIIGGIGFLLSMVSLADSLMGIEVENTIRAPAMIVSAILILMGWYGHLKTRELDAQMRMHRMERGNDPDKTIYKP